MRSISRREFLKLSAGAALAAPFVRAPWAGAGRLALRAGPTTLDRTILKGPLLGQGSAGSYFRLAVGPGEQWIVRDELWPPGMGALQAVASFVQLTDFQLADAQSPARVEFLDRFDDMACETFPLESAFRPHETLTHHAIESMNQAIRRVGRGPATGRRLEFAVATGDNFDNAQFNELRWYIDLMDGRKTIVPNSGGPTYEGVQAADWGDPEYWHPDPVSDKYKEQFGFPDYPGLLTDALKPFRARGVGIPWLQTFGNHDGLMQGNAPRNPAFADIAVGALKFDGPPPGIDPCNPFVGIGTTYLPTRPVTADPARRVILRREYVEEHFNTAGAPVGHGFTAQNRTDGTAYYVADKGVVRYISLDTVNPGGFSEGSVGAVQFAWLEQRLTEVHSVYYDAGGNPVTTSNPDRLVVLLSHHGLRSLNNPIIAPNPFDPESNDLPRIMAEEIETLLHRFPNVILWVNGHTHENLVEPHPDPAGLTPGFWEVGSSALADWNCQSRIIEVALRTDGVISIFCTMLDYAAPADPTGATGIARLASIQRELAANDYQAGFDSAGPGRGPEDRNVELVLPAPPWLAGAVGRSSFARASLQPAPA